jgi:hypothetical protein
MVHRLDIGKKLLRTLIEAEFQPTPGTNSHVMVALGAHLGVSLEIWLIQYRFAFDALFPQTFRNAGAICTIVLGHAGGQNLVNPTHGVPHRI